ncbi:MAG: VOC family protein [Calditrichaeota bacterium]|nr:MAG: VOC family protein [Calditrichota bacterium]
MNIITHVEIPAEDINRARKFYSGLFDWDFQLFEEMNYLMFQSRNEDGSAMVSGGILPRQVENHPVTNYVNVEDIDTTAKKIEELGGKVVTPKTAVPGMGWFLHFVDTEGNLLALWKNDAEAK